MISTRVSQRVMAAQTICMHRQSLEQSKDGTSRKDGAIDMVVYEEGRAERA